MQGYSVTHLYILALERRSKNYSYGVHCGTQQWTFTVTQFLRVQVLVPHTGDVNRAVKMSVSLCRNHQTLHSMICREQQEAEPLCWAVVMMSVYRLLLIHCIKIAFIIYYCCHHRV